MRAVILAGGHGTDLKPLTSRTPKHLLPIANRPALAYTLEGLAAAGFDRVGITVNGDERQYCDALGDGSGFGLRIEYLHETAPQGTAGCLRAVLDRMRDTPLLVLSGSVFQAVDLAALLAAHRDSGAVATVGVVRAGAGAGRRPQREYASVGESGELVDFEVRYRVDEDEARWRPAGVYVFERRALERIPPRIYYDLKEQLLTDLLRRKDPIMTHPLQGYYRELDDLEAYLAAHFDLLRGRTGMVPPGEELMPGVWTQGDAAVSPEAILIGPIVIGEGARVGRGARLVGPLVLGPGAEIGEGALVREAVLGRGAAVEAGACVERSLLADGARVPAGAALEGSVATEEIRSLGELNLLERDVRIERAALPARAFYGARLRSATYALVKRSFDIAFASIALVLGAPILAAAAVAVRRDSPGPILFHQTRCGRNGRTFQMLKFRSMRFDAEAVKESLRDRNQADGPVFKLADDPRMTRVGEFLRKYSLDELPQFWNVLRGDMSVVGPRPLAAEELRLCPGWRDARLRVKPGLTGLWQVSARDDNAFQNWIRHDLRYVRQQSLLLDMKIVVRTVAALAKGL